MEQQTPKKLRNNTKWNDETKQFKTNKQKQYVPHFSLGFCFSLSLSLFLQGQITLFS